MTLDMSLREGPWSLHTSILSLSFCLHIEAPKSPQSIRFSNTWIQEIPSDMPTPTKDQAQCDQLLKNLSQAEVTTLLAALSFQSTAPDTSLFARAEYLWQRPIKDRVPSNRKRTTLPLDIQRLALNLEKRCKDHRRGYKTHSVTDRRVEDDLTVLRIYTVSDLKVTERDAVKRSLERLIASKDALKSSAKHAGVEGIIHRLKGMVIELEEM